MTEYVVVSFFAILLALFFLDRNMFFEGVFREAIGEYLKSIYEYVSLPVP